NRTTMRDGEGTTTYQYDSVNRLTSIATPRGIVGYSYDKAGNRTGLTQPGAALAYTYDAMNRLAIVSLTGSRVVAYTYDSAGRNVRQQFGNDVSTALGYDTDGRLTALTTSAQGGTIDQIRYALDAVGNRTNQFSTQLAAQYQYDALNRLTSATYQTGVDV